MKRIYKLLTLILLYALMLNLVSCVRFGGPSRKYLKMKEEGYYPDSRDFPDTLWKCRELDMYFYMFDYSNLIIGEYTFEEIKYRTVIEIFYSDMSFTFYSETDAEESPSNNGAVTPIRNEAGFLVTEYIYENDLITCKIRNSDEKIWNYGGDKITFEKIGTLSKEPTSVFYCEALGMSIEKYCDFYFKGKISIDNTDYFIHGMEIGNSNYYAFYIENGRINNLKDHTDSLFVDMLFKYENDKIIARITDDCIDNKLSYPYWTSDKTTFVFVKK